ncbi:hypothetical protein IFM89_020862 [Coptis chinensis]|uniref:GTD-binding domain-containing protein n=1 Tax=Coptis chinensis TaxID=261450 RepID=A0A835IWA8_9MAGN|nr:hypothetical protein IFM89_020862 [Coptis chinensis]
MCNDCSLAQSYCPQSSDHNEENITFPSGVVEKKTENNDANSKCSCCGVSFSSDLCSSFSLFKENREDEKDENVLGAEHKRLPYIDEEQGVQRRADEDCFRSPSSRCKEIDIIEDDVLDTIEATEKEDILRSPEDSMNPSCSTPLKLENWSNFDDHFLVTIETIDSLISERDSSRQSGNSGLLGYDSQFQELVYSVKSMSTASTIETAVHLVDGENNNGHAVQKAQLDIWEPELEYMNKAETKNSVILSEQCSMESVNILSDPVPPTHAKHILPFDDDIVEAIEIVLENSNELKVSTLPKTSMWREVSSDQKLTDQPQCDDPIPLLSSLEDKTSRNYNAAGHNASPKMLMAEDDQGIQKVEDLSIEGRMMSMERIDEDHHLSKNSEDSDVDEENTTEASNHIEGLHYLRKISLPEKTESGREEFLDGSLICEISSGEGILTIDHLKSVLKEERRARCAIYEELEEERSANAVAAKQTMEMITRLQEEKAVVRLEALQYQRMMDEQSEYDQEALQLLNELVVKVEKEKHELQMELELCRKKVIHYEAKERRMIKRMSTSEMSRTHSANFSNSEDSDGQQPIDFDRASIDEDICNGHPESSNNTPANVILNLEDMDLEGSKHMSILDESLADFEAEKLSILEKLKELEEKLFTLSDEEGEFIEDIKPVVLFPEDNTDVLEENKDFHTEGVNSNGLHMELVGRPYKENGHMIPEANGFHCDTVGMENVDVLPNKEHSTTVISQRNSSTSKSMAANKMLSIEEEVNYVYERLQALEADREFLKQSISSLKKGDKGMDLLQEILQYLRDLRSVELCTRNIGDGSLG